MGADAGRAALVALPPAEAQGRLNEARPQLEEALAGKRAALGEAHPSTLSSVYNLADLLRQLGDADAAIPLLREELAGCRATLGDDHEDTRYSVRNLVGLLQEQGAAQEAAQLQDSFNDA